MSYPRQPGRPGMPGMPPAQYGGRPPSGPPKRNATPWIIAGAAVLAVAVFLVTAFAAPGFLNDEPEKVAAPAGPPPPGSVKVDQGGGTAGQPAGDDPHAVAQALVDAFNAKDAATIKGAKCANAGASVDVAINDMSSVRSAALAPARPDASKDATTYKADLVITTSSAPKPYTATLTKPAGKWCLQDVSASSTATPSGSRKPLPSPPPLR